MYLAATTALFFSLFCSLAGSSIGAAQLWQGRNGDLRCLEWAQILVSCCLAFASALLLQALAACDFSLEYGHSRFFTVSLHSGQDRQGRSCSGRSWCLSAAPLFCLLPHTAGFLTIQGSGSSPCFYASWAFSPCCSARATILLSSIPIRRQTARDSTLCCKTPA